MITKQSILILVVALLTLPSGIARASDIDIQTDSVKLTVGSGGGTNIKLKPTGRTVTPHRLTGPFYYRQYWQFRNPQSTNKVWTKRTAKCSGSSYSQQSTQTKGGGKTIIQTHSSTSTSGCR